MAPVCVNYNHSLWTSDAGSWHSSEWGVSKLEQVVTQVCNVRDGGNWGWSLHFTFLIFAHILNGYFQRESTQRRGIQSQILLLGFEAPGVSEGRWSIGTLLTSVIFWSWAESSVFYCLPEAVLVALYKFRKAWVDIWPMKSLLTFPCVLRGG